MELVENKLLVFGKENVQRIGDQVRNHRIEHSTSQTIDEMRGILRIMQCLLDRYFLWVTSVMPLE